MVVANMFGFSAGGLLPSSLEEGENGRVYHVTDIASYSDLAGALDGLLHGCLGVPAPGGKSLGWAYAGEFFR